MAEMPRATRVWPGDRDEDLLRRIRQGSRSYEPTPSELRGAREQPVPARLRRPVEHLRAHGRVRLHASPEPSAASARPSANTATAPLHTRAGSGLDGSRRSGAADTVGRIAWPASRPIGSGTAGSTTGRREELVRSFVLRPHRAVRRGRPTVGARLLRTLLLVSLDAALACDLHSRFLRRLGHRLPRGHSRRRAARARLRRRLIVLGRTGSIGGRQEAKWVDVAVRIRRDADPEMDVRPLLLGRAAGADRAHGVLLGDRRALATSIEPRCVSVTE